MTPQGAVAILRGHVQHDRQRSAELQGGHQEAVQPARRVQQQAEPAQQDQLHRLRRRLHEDGRARQVPPAARDRDWLDAAVRPLHPLADLRAGAEGRRHDQRGEGRGAAPAHGHQPRRARHQPRAVGLLQLRVHGTRPGLRVAGAVAPLAAGAQGAQLRGGQGVQQEQDPAASRAAPHGAPDRHRERRRVRRDRPRLQLPLRAAHRLRRRDRPLQAR